MQYFWNNSSIRKSYLVLALFTTFTVLSASLIAPSAVAVEKKLSSPYEAFIKNAEKGELESATNLLVVTSITQRQNSGIYLLLCT